MTGRELVIQYFMNHDKGRLREIVLASKGTYVNQTKIGCALHDMKLRGEIKVSSGVYEIEDGFDVISMKKKAEPVKPASYVSGHYQSGNKVLTELLRGMRK